MDWNKFKLGVGPMSIEVVDACLRYSKTHNFPIMFIASRNQADYDSGYSFTTETLANFIKSHEYYDNTRVKICRDHCGPNFSESDKNLSYSDIIKRCKETIRHDISNNFDLIHIDVSRVECSKQNKTAYTLIDYALTLNPDIALEFGSEDNTGENLEDILSRIDEQLVVASKYKNNIKFFVSQTGSLTKHTQVGTFNEYTNKKIAEKIHSAGFLFKEHNADYLIKDDVDKRRIAGIDSINIAPQLGSIHSSVISKLSKEFYKNEFLSFKDYVIRQGMWKKWVTGEVTDDVKFLASAHYYFNSEHRSFINKMNNDTRLSFSENLYMDISCALEQYRLGME